MAETTGIAWTDATQNFWEGCTKVGPACDACYAESRDQRWHGGKHWGPGAPRRRVVPATFARPLTWHRDRLEMIRMGDAAFRLRYPKRQVPLWVFSCSLSDFFDNEVPDAWRTDAWNVIRDCPSLRWQLVTKRLPNVSKMLPADWGKGEAYRHVGIVSTTVTQPEAERDVPRLLALKDKGVKWVGLSVEPQLGELRLRELHVAAGYQLDALAGRLYSVKGGPTGRQHHALDWIITGGESAQPGHEPRPYDITWTRRLIEDCRATGVPLFTKQLGARPVHTGTPLKTVNDPAGSDPLEWPADIRVRQMPRVYDQVAA